jgi:hypothetical protein
MAVNIVSQSTPQFGTAQTLAVDVPGSIATGNVIVFFGTHTGTLGAMPSGVQLKQNNNNAFIAWITTADHIAAGSPASYTFTTTSVLTDLVSGHTIQFSGTDLTDPFDGVHILNTSAQTTSAVLAVTTATANARLVYIDYKTATRNNTVVPTGMTQITGSEADPKQIHRFSKIQAAAGASGNHSSTYSVGSAHNSAMYALKEPTTVVSDYGDIMISGTKKDIAVITTVIGGAEKLSTTKMAIGGSEKVIP